MQASCCLCLISVYQDEPFLSLKEVILENQTAVLDSCFLQGHNPSDSSKQNFDEIEVCSAKFGPTFCPSPSSQDPELYHLMITAAKAFTCPLIPSGIVSIRTATRCWLLSHQCQEVVVNALKKSVLF